MRKKIVEEGVEIIPLNWFFLKNIQFQFFFSFYLKEIKLEKPDFVIFLEESYSTSTFEFSLFFKKVPFVFFSAQNIYKNFPIPIRKMQNYVFKRSKGALAVSKEAEVVLRKWGYNKKIFRFYLGVDPFKFNESKKIEILETLEKPIFAYIGRLTKIKGVYLLIDAFEKFYKKYKKGTLLLVGEGKERVNIKNLLISKKVNFYMLPYISHEEVYSVYKLIDFLILPSLTGKGWKEQFGRVLVEGMAGGVPVIGSDSGAIPEVIGDAGLLFKEGNSEELFRCMERLYLDKTLRDELIRKGFKRVKENFTYEVIAEKLYNFLKSLV